MRLTARRLNRATLARQLLLRREPLEVAEAVRSVVALQAQAATSPYLALWNRLPPAADSPRFRRALVDSLRAARLNGRRYSETGLSADAAVALIPHLVQYTAERH